MPKKRPSTPGSPPSPASKPKVLIVDGHSMIFQWPELRALHGRNGPGARGQLTGALTRYQDATGTHVVVVFDGTGVRTNEATEPCGVQVFYSKAGKTADAVIERLVATYAEKYDIVVATDDHLERTTVETFGGTWMSSESLALDLRAADDDLAERIARLRRR